MQLLGKIGKNPDTPEDPDIPNYPEHPNNPPRECPKCNGPVWWEDRSGKISCATCEPPMVAASIKQVWLAYYDTDPGERYWKPWKTTHWNPFLV